MVAKKNISLISSILITFLISYGHFISSNFLVIFGILMFVFLLIIAEDIYKIAILFFFISWNGLLKISIGGHTFFGVGVLITVMMLLLNNYRLKNLHILFILFFYSLIIKLWHYDTITLRYFFTFIFLLFISIIGSNHNKLVDFKIFTKFFFIGTITANTVAYFLTKLPKFYELTKGAEVQLEESWGIFRMAGFNGDPNRNALQIAFAIGCLLIMIEKSKKYKIISYLGVFILFYFGLLSVSKMFYLMAVLISFIYFSYFFIKSQNLFQRFLFPFAFITLILILLNTSLFQEQIEILIERNNRTGSNDLSTGRLGLQMAYINYLLENLGVLFFGRGFLTDYIPIINVAHNTIIQGVFGLGLIGSGLFLKVILSLSKKTNRFYNYSKQNLLLYIMPILILVIGVLSLDLLNMDAFYFYLILLLALKRYIFNPV
jgi:hypothetical protein